MCRHEVVWETVGRKVKEDPRLGSRLQWEGEWYPRWRERFWKEVPEETPLPAPLQLALLSDSADSRAVTTGP